MAQTIMGIYIPERMEKAPEFQKVLSKNGCTIRTRIGLHDASKEICSPAGVVVLDLIDDKEAIGKLQTDLEAIGLEVKVMNFDQ